VCNSDFGLGNQCFTNDYNYFTPGNPTAIGSYSVLQSNQIFAANSQWACIDHTTYSSTGQMLIVDGYGGPIAWQQQQPVSVTAGTTYAYSAWFNNLVVPSKNYADPIMGLFVGNTSVAGPLTLTEMDDRWVRLCGTWTAPSSGQVTLSIRMLSTANIGNDVAIDDIGFRACVPPPTCQISINVTQNSNCTVTVCAVSSGQQAISYQWCDGRTDACFTTSPTPCVPTTYCVTATCADGSTSTASVTHTLIDNTPPTCVAVPGFGVTLNPNCTYTLNTNQIDGGSTDNCGIQSMSISPTVLTGRGNTTVTLTVTDWCNNTSTCTTTVQTIELVPPTIMCPPSVQFNCNSPTTPSATGFATATDICSIPLVTYTDVVTGSQPCNQNILRVWTATDACNNTSTCSQTITVADNVPPNIPICPADISILGAFGPLGCTARCINPLHLRLLTTVTPRWPSNAPAIYPGGSTTIIWTATDDCGNTKTCAQVVRVDCCNTCPTGNGVGVDLVVDGSFNIGNQFSSSYAPLPPLCQPEEYVVTNSIGVTGLCNNWTGIDHTTGSPTGQFFAADGSQTLNVDAWRQQINLTTNVTYSLCAYANNLNEPTFNLQPDPVVEAWRLDANFVPVGPLVATTGALPEVPDTWVLLSASWTAPTNLPNPPYYLAFRTSGTSFGGNNFALDDISFKACIPPGCTCGSYTNMSYRPTQGAPNISVMCGDSIFASCIPQFNWTLGGNFMCQGSNCAATTDMFWSLYSPNGPLVASDPNMTASPNFLVSIPSNTFSTAGTYTLTIGAICGQDTCYCTYYITSLGCSCCNDYDLFCQNVMNAVNYTVSSALCKITLNIGNLPNCDYIESVNWGDGSQSLGPFTSGSMPMHNYNGSGTYAISYLAIETNPLTGLICFEKILYDTITLVCNETVCEANFVLNGDFEVGTPPGADESICAAANWCGIWLDAPFPVSIGDYHNSTTAPPPGLAPLPLTQGDYGAFWCRITSAQQVWREGIMNRLATAIPQNSGCYKIEFKVACTGFHLGNPVLSIYGANATSLSSGITPTDGITPSNLALFPGAAVELGTYPIPAGGCDENFQTITLFFDASTLPAGGINHIFLTRSDNMPNGSRVYLAVDDVCIQSVPCDNCECGSMEWAEFYREWDWHRPIACTTGSTPTLQVPCLNTGQNYFVHGDFTCNSATCASSTITWQLTGPSTSANGLLASSSYPHFDLSLSGTYFTQPGIYTFVTLTGKCVRLLDWTIW
jgi:hypothetical protein